MKSKFTWIFTLLLAFFIQFSFAQEKTVTGTVIATSDGFPIPGVNVMVKGTSSGVQTGIDGKYSITAPVGSTLEFSFVGMQTVTQVVGASNSINVSMADDAKLLDEVVVVAYGVQKKEAITGSIGEIKSEQIATITTGNILQGTVGKVAGVQVFNNSGMPGDGPTIRMRGIGSINASAAPLYVVDGIPFSGDIASINGMDVESMTFLKDASAAALYGNRGANGVIIITTKKGKNQKSTITLDSRTGFASRATKEYDIVTGEGEYYEAYWRSLRNNYMVSTGLSAAAAGNTASAQLIEGPFGLRYNAYDVPNEQLIDPVTGKFTGGNLKYNEDWSEFLFGSGLFTQTHMSVAGGSDKTTHFFSAGYEKNEGYVVNSGLEKITARVKLDSEITSNVKAGMNIGYTHIVQNYLDGYTGDTSYSSPFFWTRTVAPIYPVHLFDRDGNPVYDANGNHLFDDGQGVDGDPSVPIRPFGSPQNPYATAINDIKQWTTDNLFVNGYVDVKILDGLNFTYTATGDLFNRGDRDIDTPFYGDASGDIGGRSQYTNSRQFAITQQQLLKYNKVFGDHGVDLLLGHETLDRRDDVVFAHRTKLLLPTSGYVDHAQVLQGNRGYGTSYALEGFFSRLNYDFKNRYYVNASIRRDGSSRFHPDNRWGTFYGLGAAWRIKQESFLKDVSWIDELRVKASYGEQGNDNLGLETPYLNLYQLNPTTNSDLDFQYSVLTEGNPLITWETNVNFNAGFDVSLFDNRLSIEAEYFERRVYDMLYNRPLGPSGGVSERPENSGDMENVGFEVTIGADVVRTNDFTLSVSANLTHYKNEITKLPFNGRENNFFPAGSFIREEGGSVYDFYLREFAGVNHETGAALFWMDDEANPGQRILTEEHGQADLYRIEGKSAIPDAYGGFSFDFKYKQFDLGVQFAYQFGGYAYDAVWAGMLAPSIGENFHNDVANSWTVDNKDATLPISMIGDPNQYYNQSTLGLIKSDYLSIQNVSVGYTFSSEVAQSIGLSSLRLYGLVDNVHLWSKRQGFDPRMNGVAGQSTYNYSLLRNASIGLNVQF